MTVVSWGFQNRTSTRRHEAAMGAYWPVVGRAAVPASEASSCWCHECRGPQQRRQGGNRRQAWQACHSCPSMRPSAQAWSGHTGPQGLQAVHLPSPCRVSCWDARHGITTQGFEPGRAKGLQRQRSGTGTSQPQLHHSLRPTRTGIGPFQSAWGGQSACWGALAAAVSSAGSAAGVGLLRSSLDHWAGQLRCLELRTSQPR